MRELATAKDRDEKLAIDALAGRKIRLTHAAEAIEPRVVPFDARFEAGRARVVQALVVFREAEARGQGRRVLVFLLQERVDERTERRRHSAPPCGRLSGALPRLRDNGLENKG